MLVNVADAMRRMCELMFETFEVPALFMSKDAVLSCYAVGRTSGLVIDCGASGEWSRVHQSPVKGRAVPLSPAHVPRLPLYVLIVYNMM
jgi:hypothetical protein